MSEREYLNWLRGRKGVVITRWLKKLTELYPESYDRITGNQGAEVFFDFMLDLAVPLEQHSHFQMVPLLCESLYARGIPSEHILHSNQLWRDSLLKLLEEEPEGQTFPLGLLRQIINRVDTFESHIFRYYTRMTQDLLDDKDRAITELHEARRNAVGKLAAGMAHEIRNPLTALFGFTKMMRGQLAAESYGRLPGYLDIMEEELSQIHMQVTGFLSFSEKEIIEEAFTRISSKALLESVLAYTASRMADEHIQLTVTSMEDRFLFIQKTAIRLVISHIFTNSMDALARKEGGKRIAVSATQEGGRYRISIANNGPEISSELREGLFEPFETVKDRETGFGLAVSRQMMKKNNGEISYSSDAEETVFHLIFREHPLPCGSYGQPAVPGE
ncbi:HAMP domain-containing histidine kinase [Paenibacillus sp. CC-CFT747]|nr:HAMP domain-containing histidine kinase [Paenibacillus sp. CC-CFT747]